MTERPFELSDLTSIFTKILDTPDAFVIKFEYTDINKHNHLASILIQSFDFEHDIHVSAINGTVYVNSLVVGIIQDTTTLRNEIETFANNHKNIVQQKKSERTDTILRDLRTFLNPPA